VNAGIITMLTNIVNQAEIAYTNSITALAAQFEHRYRDRCLATLNETFLREYQFDIQGNCTLYYYDQAGNLQRTVPPLGVGSGTNSGMLQINQPLAVGSVTFPAYSSSVCVANRYVSQYKYNTYNLPVSDENSDGGFTTYMYDTVGRIVISQNAKQAALGNVYSFTKYDDIGRILKVGQVALLSALSTTATENLTTLYSTIASGTITQVTNTYYDNATANSTILAKFTGSLQNHLRNRVAYIQYEETDDNDTATCDNATFYSYDDHGNVKELVQYIKALEPLLKGVSKVAYEYELISGNMVKASYEPGMPDQFMHKYNYDADNRLHEVFTSRDDLNWDRDAKYFYYEHGPLARIERADKQVQGTDYFYTIHGWIKGVNSDNMDINSDAGKDAAYTSAYLNNYSKVHGWFARDAMSYGLTYYNDGTNKDFAAINSGNFNASTNINPVSTTTNLAVSGTFSLAMDGPSLYNGNISSMVTSLMNKDMTTNQTLHPVNTPFAQLTAYRYDQLHRITQMKAYSGAITQSVNTWVTPTLSTNFDNSYYMNFKYDANGNIKALQRMGAGTTIKSGLSLYMDSLQYRYNNIAGGFTTNTNKLMSLKETSVSIYTDDIDAPTSYPGTDRYDYDATGNLIKDDGEYIADIEWTVDRKVSKVTRDAAALLAAGANKSDIEYQYDGMRRRIAKIVKPRDPSTKALMDVSYWTYTYYNYDASGNVMATYARSGASIGGPSTYQDKLLLQEHHLYGASRLGVKRPEDIIQWTATYTICGSPTLECRTYSASSTATPAANFSLTGRSLGYKEFELTNHLGNVIATVSDRKIQFVKCKTFNGSPIDEDNPVDNNSYNRMIAVNSNTTAYGSTAGADSLKVQPTARYGGINQSFTAAVTGSVYTIAFDVNIGTTAAADSLYAKLYGFSSAMGPGSDSAYVLINSSGHYELTYTAEPATMNFKMYYNGVNTSSSTARVFYAHNLYISDAIPLNPPAPGASVNVLATCNHFAGADLVYYFPDLLSHTDYYAFGQSMPGRTWIGTSDKYRYSHNDQEKEDEIYTHAQSAEYWMYDARIGRRWNIDPIVDESVSPYAAFANNPILLDDPDGLAPGNWSRFWGKVGAFFRHPIKFMGSKWYRHNFDARKKGNTKKHWSVGEVFMKIGAALRRGSLHSLMLIPQGEWENTPWMNAGSGTLNSGDHSSPIPITTPKDQFKRKVSGIRLAIGNPDPNSDGPVFGYARVTGVYRHGRDRAKYRTMFTNTGSTGFTPQYDNTTGSWGGYGHAGFLTSLPQYAIEAFNLLFAYAPNLLPGDEVIKFGDAAIAADALNDRVFTPFRNVSAIRVENVISAKPLSYQLSIRYRQWNQIPSGRRGWLWKVLHDASGNKGRGF
jgi:RHS repeat-associated protein